MRARLLALLAAVALLIPTAAAATAADAPPPPTITPVCATDYEYFWTISGDETGPAGYQIDYTTKKTDDWQWPHGMMYTSLRHQGAGGAHMTIATARSDGSSLYVRWTDFPTAVASTSKAPTTTCAMATLTVKRVIVGGSASADRFPVDVVRSTSPFIDPSTALSSTTTITSDESKATQPGSYRIQPKEKGQDIAAPAGYAWRQTYCVMAVPGEAGALGGGTTDPRYRALAYTLEPGGTLDCTITYRFGPQLYDTIAAGKKGSGASVWEFQTESIAVAKGSWVTYRVTTSPGLAGKKVQIWTKIGSASKPWKLTKTVTLAADGTVRDYAKVTAYTEFQARWPGDTKYPATKSEGRIATVQ